MNEENEEERGEKRKREDENEENKTESVKRRCEAFVSVEAFEIYSQEGDLESCGGFSCEDFLEKPEGPSDCEPDFCAHVRVVPVVTDVLVSPSSKYFCKKKKRSLLPAGPDGMRSGEAWSIWKEDVHT